MKRGGKLNPVAAVLMLILALAGMYAVLITRNGLIEHGSGLDSSSLPEAPEYVEAGFSDIYTWSSAASGRAIRIKGRLHICNGTEEWVSGDPVPDGEMVLYRFVVTCCPGHAVPSVVRIKPTDRHGFLYQDDWVEARGRIDIDESPGSIPVLAVDEVTPLDSAPEQAEEQFNPPSKMGAPCAGSRPDIPYPPR